MPALTETVRQLYADFSRGNIPAMLQHVADDVDWECVCPPALPYAGRRRTRDEVAKFFTDIPKADQIHQFEPREFIDGGDHVTVLGVEQSTALETQKEFTSEWVHVFSFKGGKITRWRGFFNTAARYRV